MTLETYTTRCSKLQFVNFAYMFQWVKPRGSTLCKGLGAMLPLPVKWPRLSGAIGAGLQRRYITCGAWHHMKPIPDEMSTYGANSMWYLYQIKYYFKPVPHMTYTSMQNPCKTYIRLNITSNLYQIWHILQSCTRYFFNTKKNCFKPTPDITKKLK